MQNFEREREGNYVCTRTHTDFMVLGGELWVDKENVGEEGDQIAENQPFLTL